MVESKRNSWTAVHEDLLKLEPDRLFTNYSINAVGDIF